MRNRTIHAVVWAGALAFAVAAGERPGGAEEARAAGVKPASDDAGVSSAAAVSGAEGRRMARTTASGTEPSVEELCQAAVTMAMAEPERARSFLSRARLAGWLPELRFRIFRRFARTEGLTLDDTATTTPVDVSAVDDVRYEWRATWDLSRMVFNPEELQAHAEALRMADVRRDIQSLVVRLYFERRRLSIVPGAAEGSTATSGAGANAEARRRLRVAEIEAQLEALAGRSFFGTAGGATAGGSVEAHP